MDNQDKKGPARRYDPLNDFLFYKVMGEKGSEPQLLGFLNALFAESGRKPIASLKIRENRALVREIMEATSCVLDVSAVLSDGTLVNIEVQLRNRHNMDRRSLFYWGRLYTKALKKGRDYVKLPDVISVNIMGYDFPRGGKTHTTFRLREDSNRSLVLTTALEIHFVNMVKWRRQREKDLAGNPLHRWLAWFDAKSSPELLQEAKGMDATIATADERQEFVMLDEDAQDLYERRQKAEWDRASELNDALRRGLKRGLVEGERKGLMAGKLESRLEIMGLIDKGYSIEDIRRELSGKG